MDGEVPRRRSDDSVSYREMVEYVNETEVKMHTVRAESLIQVGNALEKIEERLEKHEEWHRDFLARLLADRRQNGIALLSIVVAILSLVASIAIAFKHA